MTKRCRGANALTGILLAVVSVCLSFGVSGASEVERVIPVVRDDLGNGIDVEIARDGSRQTATPCVSVARPPDEASASPCSIGTLRRRAAQGRVSKPAVAVPEEITARNAKGVFKALRAAYREKQALPAVGQAAVPEPVRVATQR